MEGGNPVETTRNGHTACLAAGDEVVLPDQLSVLAVNHQPTFGIGDLRRWATG